MFRSLYLAAKTFMLSILLWVNTAQSQERTATIDFSGTEKQIRKSKSILRKHQLSIELANQEVNLSLSKDNLLEIQDSSEKLLSLIDDKEYIKIKFVRGKKCFDALMPNRFGDSKSIRSFMIYKTTRNSIYFGKIGKRYALNFAFSSEGQSENIPISLIPCTEYSGEYDNGLAGYLETIGSN